MELQGEVNTTPTNTGSLNGLSVLVVDDAPDNRALMRILLQREGATVREAASGTEAIAITSAEAFDVVLMDIQMPGMDGFEALMILRTGGYSRPVLALTAHALQEDRARTRAAGFDDHITKPINRQILVEVVLRHAPIRG